MESIIEILVEKEKDSADKMKETFTVIGALAVIIAAFVFLKGFGIIVAAGACYLAYRIYTGLNVEFEYCVIDGDIVIDKVLNKSRRKKFIAIDRENIEMIAPVGSPMLDDVRRDAKTYFAAGKRGDENNFAIIGRSSKGNAEIIVQMSDRMKEHLKPRLPRKFYDS